MKKVLSIVLSLAMLFSITAGLDLSVSAETSGDFEYTVLDDGTAEITGYTGRATDLIIPSELDGYTVTSLGENAFIFCDFKSIEIPNSITSIGYNCVFPNSTSFESISVDENNQYYSSQDGVLFNKDKTELIKYPAGITRTSYDISDNVTIISHLAFCLCESLTNVTIPKSVTRIDYSAFGNCSSLTDITIFNPECDIYNDALTISDTAIIKGYAGSTAQAYAEAYGREFTEISDSGNTGDLNEDLFNGVLHTGECKVSITEDMTDIEYQSPYARYYEEVHLFRPEFSMTYEYSSTVNVTGNSTDTSVQLMAEIYDSDYNCLYQTEGSSSVDFKYSFEAGKTYILMNTLIIITDGIYISDLVDGGITLSTTVDLNASDVEDYLNSNCENDDPYNEGWKIGDEVYGLAFIDFDGSVIDFYPDDSGLTDYNTQSINKNITSVIIPSKVDTNYSYANFYLYSIDDYAEMKVTNINIDQDMAYVNLKNIYLPYSIECINSISGINWYPSGEIACNIGLKEISLPSSVTVIGAPAFNYCTGLTNITIPESVESIGEGAFVGCSSLTNVTILNRKCDLDHNTIIFPLDNSITIYGYYCSTAQQHAKEMGFEFTPLDNSTPQADRLGASIRVTDAGLRFGFSFDETQSIMPEEYGFVYAYSETNDLTVDSVGTNGVKQKVAGNKINHGDYTTFNLVFTNIPSSAFDSVVSARAYVKIDGEYYYSDVLQRSYRQVANAVLADDEIDDETKNAVREILGEEA